MVKFWSKSLLSGIILIFFLGCCASIYGAVFNPEQLAIDFSYNWLDIIMLIIGQSLIVLLFQGWFILLVMPPLVFYFKTQHNQLPRTWIYLAISIAIYLLQKSLQGWTTLDLEIVYILEYIIIALYFKWIERFLIKNGSTN